MKLVYTFILMFIGVYLANQLGDEWGWRSDATGVLVALAIGVTSLIATFLGWRSRRTQLPELEPEGPVRDD